MGPDSLPGKCLVGKRLAICFLSQTAFLILFGYDKTMSLGEDG